MEKDQLNYCKAILEMFNINNEDFINMSDTEIKNISNNFSTAEVLDKQSGIRKSVKAPRGGQGFHNSLGREDKPRLDGNIAKGHDDIGGCSKILHKCNYEEEDYDIYNYQPKVSKSERNAGCDEFEDKEAQTDFGSGDIALKRTDRVVPIMKNNHPTLKPIALNEKILKLFKTPNDDKIVYPFAGSGSEIIGGIKAGFKNWVGCEINPDYVEIAKARIDYWTTQDEQLDIFDLIGAD